MLVGYARVSTNDQNLELQLKALTDAGCEKIFSDKMSGVRGDRPGLLQALSYARKGDALVIWKLDRLGRSLRELLSLASDLREKGVELRSITDGIDTTTAAGRFFFHVMSSLAEMERELIVERTRAGLQAAKRAGRKGGRKTAIPRAKREAAHNLLSSGKSHKEVAEAIGVTLPTLYRHFPASTYSDQKMDK